MKVTFFKTPADLREWRRQEATRMKRFEKLVASSAAGERVV